MLVRARTKLINCVRGLVKPSGLQLPACASAYFTPKVAELIPPSLLPAIAPLLEPLDSLSNAIVEYDEQIAHIARTKRPETAWLEQVSGVGALTALAFVLTVSDPHRFTKSRQLGSYFGLRPKQDQSGERSPQLGISKSGDPYLRQLLVGSAHAIAAGVNQFLPVRARSQSFHRIAAARLHPCPPVPDNEGGPPAPVWQSRPETQLLLLLRFGSHSRQQWVQFRAIYCNSGA